MPFIFLRGIMKKYYECYSEGLHNYLIKNGLRPIRSFVHNKTKVVCYVYLMTSELSKLLNEWTETNPNRWRHY